MSQLHDNILASYEVDFGGKRLVLHTEYWYEGKLAEKTTVVFSGYLAHHFTGARLTNILFDICKEPVDGFLQREAALVQDGKGRGWPIVYKTHDCFAELPRFMQEGGYHPFKIMSSFGLTGWILAQNMEILEGEA